MTLKQNKPKRTYRLPPCPAYDIEGTESWLESMAEQGWFLNESGFFAGIAIFEKGTPKSVRYRLEAAPQSTSIWSDHEGKPEEEALTLASTCGWEYVASRGEFYIYTSGDPAAQELHTDPMVQALALDLVRKRERSSLFSTLLWAAVYPLCRIQGNILLSAIGIGTWLYLLGKLLVVWATLSSLIRVFYLRRLRKRLANGEMPNHKKDWRKRAHWHKAEPFLFLALALLWGISLFHGWSLDITDENKLDLKIYTEELPFGTMETLIPGGEFKWNDFGIGNTIEVKSDWLAPKVISFSQQGCISQKDGTLLQGGLSIDYFETISPWLARELAREYQTYDRHKNHKHYSELNIPDLDVDYARAYTAIFPTLVLAEGNRMIRISFYQTSDNYTMPLEQWAGIFAESFKTAE